MKRNDRDLSAEIQRCRAEQLRAAAYLQSGAGDEQDRRGAWLGLCDAFAEELILTGEWKMAGLEGARMIIDGTSATRVTVPLETPRDRLLCAHEALCNAAHILMEKKNADYASDADPFRNFRTFGRLGILVRLSDKLSRLRTFCERGELSVTDESITDTVLDGINYLILFHEYKEQ